MNKQFNNSYCTSPKWLGRANCEKCHIRRLMLFSELPTVAFKDLLQPIDHFIYPHNAILYETSTNKKFLYSIRRGMVKLVHIANDGSKRIVRLQGPGSVIGLELLDGTDNYHHSAIAINEVDLCKIPVQTIKQLEGHYPELCDRVRKQLQTQLNLADQWIVALGTGIAKQRVAQLLLMLNEFHTNKEDEFFLLNREDMAAMIGTALETVSRIIAEFKRSNLLYKTKNNLYTCDVAALSEITKHS